MLISSNGFFFLGALPPTQLMGLTGTGRAGDDTRRGLDPAQPPREDAWGRTASQLPGGEQSPARVLHTPQQGGVWAAPLVLDRPRSSPTSSHVAGVGLCASTGLLLCPAAPTLCEQSLCKWFCSSGVLFSPLWRDLRLLLGGIINQRIN